MVPTICHQIPKWCHKDLKIKCGVVSTRAEWDLVPLHLPSPSLLSSWCKLSAGITMHSHCERTEAFRPLDLELEPLHQWLMKPFLWQVNGLRHFIAMKLLHRVCLSLVPQNPRLASFLPRQTNRIVRRFWGCIFRWEVPIGLPCHLVMTVRQRKINL